MDEKFNFNISLSVLNHLGRNLYRNLITVLGEAISNSWDADAKNVWITIDREKGIMEILDDGLGMSAEDFQNKFLKIGYSKRKDDNFKSALGRPYIGRKGIGKLALLSCAKKIHIATKMNGSGVVGGVIDNTGLDAAIKDDLNSQEYILDALGTDIIEKVDSQNSGTLIFFETITDGIFNTIEYIKKSIALYFRFSLIDPNFNIYVNGEQITERVLSELASKTQFLWVINGMDDPFLDTMKNLQEKESKVSDISIKGYIASVQRPSDVKIRGTQEKVTIDLFVNGRLREKDILRHMPTARIVENYVYGQVHFDELDSGDGKDAFTSSRESVISDDPRFKKLIEELSKIFREIVEQWDDFRRKHGLDGDSDNMKIPPKQRKAEELFHTTMDDYKSTEGGDVIQKGGIVEEWAKKLAEEAKFNIPSYTECFISENLLRQYAQYTKMQISPEAHTEADKWRKREETSKETANISFDIRVSDHDLYYLDMQYLANLVDKVKPDNQKGAALSRSATTYKPMRDAVGHTSLLTESAKRLLTTEYENIKARLVKLLQMMNQSK